MAKAKDYAGKKIGKLTPIKIVSRTRDNKHVRWLCKCDCGNDTEVTSTHLSRAAVKSCGCLIYVKGKEHKNWKGFEELSGNVWDSIKRNSKAVKRTGVDFSITIEFAWYLFLKQDRKCALTGLELTLSNYKDRTASLDRIDNSKGYVEGNVQWVHKRINMMKHVLDQNYFIYLCKAVASYNNN